MTGWVAASLGGMQLEAPPLGMGNLERYVREVRPEYDDLIVEDYWIVLPMQEERHDD